MTPQKKQELRERRRVDTEPEPLDNEPLTPEEARRQLGWNHFEHNAEIERE